MTQQEFLKEVWVYKAEITAVEAAEYLLYEMEQDIRVSTVRRYLKGEHFKENTGKWILRAFKFLYEAKAKRMQSAIQNAQ